MPFHRITAVLPLVFLASIASTWAPSAAGQDAPVALTPTTVTATRTDSVLSESLASATVITRADIERLQPQDVQDLLAGLPGVSLANNGGPGKITSLFLRGTESDHVLVLLDGIKMGSATSGSFAFQDLPVEQIERIEIVRGPRSSLYGSEAIGGVIQIFTRRGGGGEARPVPSFAIQGGSLGSRRGELGLRGSLGEGGWYGLSVAGRETDGIDVQPGNAEPDDDGYQNLSGLLRGGWRFEGGAELALSALRVESENEYDGSFSDYAENTQQALGANLRLSPLARWQLDLQAGESRDRADTYKGEVAAGDFETRRRYLAWQNDVELAGTQLLSLGADHQDDTVEGSTVYERDSRDDTGAYVQYQGEFGRHRLQASLRHDDNEQFGTHQTGALAWGYDLMPGLHFNAGYGTAFKAPSFNELYFPDFGNPDLDPEQSRNIELGLAGEWSALEWRLDAFRTELDDLIAYDAAIFAPGNVDKAVIKGAELSVAAARAALSLHGYLSWLDPENRSDGANRGKVLPRRARRTARLELDYALGRAGFGATLHAVGARYDDLANSTELGGYATVDLRAEYRLRPSWRLQASARNLLDKQYVTAGGFEGPYAQPGDTYYLGLRYTPAGGRR